MPLDVLFKLSNLHIVEREPGPGRTVIPAPLSPPSWHFCVYLGHTGDFTWPGQNPSAVSSTLDHLS